MAGSGPVPVGEIFAIFLKLGLTSFGGPVAHLGYFRTAFVERLRWIDERGYADLVALCQFMPGPASSQVGLAIGLAKGGVPGAFAAWAGFTLPSAALLIAFAYGVTSLGDAMPAGLLQGLKVAAVAVVVQAVWGMARTLTPDAQRVSLAVIAAAIVLALPGPLAQIGAIVAGGLAGLALFDADRAEDRPSLDIAVSRHLALGCLAAFLALLVLLPVLASAVSSQWLAMFDSYFRAGSLVFGGGHVVLPLLQAETVSAGWVSDDAFLAGYGAAQAVPGPLFTFAAYLGAVATPSPNGLAGGLIALVAIFLPSYLLVFGLLPFWDSLRRRPNLRRALTGVNAAVVGLLLAALYDPIWTEGIRNAGDFVLGMAGFTALVFWKLPPWLVVLLSALGGWAIALV
ncbi:MAG: chromate efflux transporter [Pseudomonadota bacterium]